MKRSILILAAAALSLAGCSGSDEPTLDEQAENREEQMSASPDSPAPPLSEEEQEADLGDLMTDEEQIDLIFTTEMNEAFWVDSTEAERQDACSDPAEIPEAAELLADQWIEEAAKNDLNVGRPFMVKLVSDWFTEQCAQVDTP